MNDTSNQGLWNVARAAAIGTALLFGGPVTYAVAGSLLAYNLFTRENEKSNKKSN